MNAEQFVIVATENSGYGGETVFHFANSTAEALARIAQLNNPREVDAKVKVERVFCFNEYGRVTHYRMVLDGFMPKLEEILEEAKTPSLAPSRR